MLFYSGSHRSFISSEAVEKLGLRLVRKENLIMKVFGSKSIEEKVKEVV